MAENRDTRDVTRRSALGWIAAAAPAIVAVSGAPRAGEDAPTEAPPPPPLSDEARSLSKRAPGLSGDERRRLRKQLPGFEAAIQKLRDFELPDDVEPAFRFRALRSDRRSR